MLHPISNGNHYGWSGLRSLFDFFFPYMNVGIRKEMESTSWGRRDFYTFRAFARFYLAQPWVLYKRAWQKRGFVPRLVYQIGAIAFDTDVLNEFDTATSETQSLTASGPNPMVFLTATNTAGTITSTPTYAGVNFIANTTSTTGVQTYYSYFLTGQSGTNDVVVNYSATPQHEFVATAYSGAAQVGTLDATNVVTKTASGAYTLDGTVDSVADNCWAHAYFAGTGAAGAFTVGTARQTYDQTATADSGPKTPAGTISFQGNQTAGGSRTSFIQMMSFAPAGAAGAASGSTHLLMGV